LEIDKRFKEELIGIKKDGGNMCISVFDCRTTDQAVEITLLRRPMRKISFSNIADIAHGSKGAFGEVLTIFK